MAVRIESVAVDAEELISMAQSQLSDVLALDRLELEEIEQILEIIKEAKS